jgi:apolipoprotein N-acyltransferase
MFERLRGGALVALTGLLLVLIQPGTGWNALAILALTPLMLGLPDLANMRDRFLAGWLAGFIQWSFTCYWIQGTLERHGGMGFAGSCIVFVLFALAKGLHLAAFTALAGRIHAHPFAPLVLALLWAGLERTHAPLGFTWLMLGDAAPGPLPRLAPYTGVYGCSFVLAFTALMIPRRQHWWIAFAPWILVTLLPELPAEAKGAKTAIAVQPAFVEERREANPEEKLIRLTEGALARVGGSADLIVWPEMPIGLYWDAQERVQVRIAELARSARTPVLFGTVAGILLDSGQGPLNSAQLVDAEGRPVIRYDKVNLVPFGEYVPWPFDGIIGKVSDEAGNFRPGARPLVFPLNGAKAGAFICYESAFPHYVREFAQQGAGVLINLTNDGYFARTAARAQHLQLARMRAIENRRWILRPTNDGYTASIDPAGRVYNAAPPYESAAAALKFNQVAEQTVYTQYGDWFAWSALAIGLGYFLRPYTLKSPST